MGMTATEALERRIDELCRENEKLRQDNNTLRDQIDTAKHNSVRNTREYARLCHVNDKLRELVSVLAHCAADSGCDSCPINGGCARVRELDLCETVHDRMRELGVEAE